MTSVPMRILLVEDSLGDAVMLEDMLLEASGGAFVLSRADRMSGALDQLARTGFDAILLDLTLPDSHGLQTLESIRKYAANIPTIILTGIADEETAISAIRHGAQDYLVKGTADGRAVAKSIRYAIDRRKTEEALRRSDAAYAAAKVSVDTVDAMAEGVALIGMDGTVSYANPALTRLTGYPAQQLKGRHLAEVFPSILDTADLASAQSALKTAMRGEAPEMGEATLISNPLKPVPIILRMTFIKDHSRKPTAVVLTIQDITAHKKAESQERIVADVLALFARKASRKEYMDAVAEVIRQWSGCRCFGIRILNDAGEAPYESHIGFPDEFMRSETALKIRKCRCVCSRVIERRPDPEDLPCLTSGGSFLCGNTTAFMNSLPEKARERFKGVCAANGLASISVVPIQYRSATVGAMLFADEKAQRISAEMVAFAESTLSTIVGEAIHRFDIETELRSLSLRLTLAEERARRQLAVALHDSVGQSLALGKLKLGALGRMLTAEEPLTTLNEISDMFEEAVRQIRTLSFELSPPILYELGLGAALEWLGEDFAARHGFRVHFDGTGRECTIAEPVSVLLFQSARELLTNIAKHAGATEVSVSLQSDNARVSVKIVDNGRGMAPNAPGDAIRNRNSLGLFSIRERMKQIGGTFEIQSEPGRGTTVTLSAPVEAGPETGAGA